MSALIHPRSLLVSLALLAAACGGGEDAPPLPPVAGAPNLGATAETPPPARGEPLRATSNAGTFVAEVTPLGGPVPMNAHFGVELALTTPDGAPFTPEEVTLDARMEEHEHGMLRDVALTPAGAGRWRADGLLFHMVGVWQFQVDVRQGAHIERAQMDLLLR